MAFFPGISILTSIYKGGDYLPHFFRNLREQTLFPELEIKIILNEPSGNEKRQARDFQLRWPDQVELLFAHERETLGASWNRGWKASRAPYLAMWNIDDRRVIDSLQRQLASMEGNPEWALCYGDYVTVYKYGEEQGIRRFTPSYSSSHFRQSFAQGGAFWLFRRNVSKKIGYFDEQLFVGSDMEFSFRMATKGLEMGKCKGLLGYFTDASDGLSTRDGARKSKIERTVIQVRYGVFDKVNRDLIEAAKDYRFDFIKQGNSWISMREYFPNLDSYLQSRKFLWILGFFRHWYRKIMTRLGLLNILHREQKKYLKREI